MDELLFKFEPDEDGWPPVGIEGMPVVATDGGFRITTPPFFIKDVSVGDILSVELDGDGRVSSWRHTSRSSRSTIWLLGLGGAEIDGTLASFRALGCNTEVFPSYKLASVDVAEEIDFERIDALLNEISTDGVAVAFPSFRHGDTT